MTKAEFTETAKELGYTDREICEKLALIQEDEGFGVVVDYEVYLMPKPISYPTNLGLRVM